jgi:outer membrane immunogenic protein
VTLSESHFHSGWTVGAGIEAFIAPNWSVKGEYLYRSLGSESYFGVPTGTLNLHSGQVGVNYHFGGPVVAKY